jgi:hypothetical protein
MEMFKTTCQTLLTAKRANPHPGLFDLFIGWVAVDLNGNVEYIPLRSIVMLAADTLSADIAH